MSDARLQQLLQFQRESPDDSFIAFAIAKEYENLGERKQALDCYLQLKKQHPSYVGLYYHLGKLYEQLSKWKEAFETYKEGMAVARREGDRHALNELAGAKLNLGDDEDFE